MKTIKKLIPYELTKKQINELTNIWIINWIWWKWWISFNKLFRKIKKIKWFKIKKYENLYNDINTLSIYHDIDFYTWNTIKSFIRANYNFSVRVIQLLHWSSIFGRLFIFLILFLWLNIFWIRFYNWKRKKDFIFKKIIMNYENETPWIILDEKTISIQDYIIWRENPLYIPENTNINKYFYNQRTKREPTTSWSCWIFASMWCISDLTWYEFNEEDINEINQLAIDKYGLEIWVGMYMSKAVDCVRDWWNINKDKKLISFRTTIWSEEFADWLKKNHSFAVWYRLSSEYYRDSQDDWIINKLDFPKNGGHLVRVNFDEHIQIDDNYEWSKKYNTYINNYINVLKENWVYFPSAYLFLYDETMEDEILNNIDLNWAKEWYLLGLWNWLDPRKSASRQETVVMIMNALELAWIKLKK